MPKQVLLSFGGGLLVFETDGRDQDMIRKTTWRETFVQFLDKVEKVIQGQKKVRTPSNNGDVTLHVSATPEDQETFQKFRACVERR